MRTLGIIPARAGSKGIPGKNLKPFNGVPLLKIAIDKAWECPSINAVVVSSEDGRTLGLAKQWGARPCFRPHELAGDDVPTLPVLEHVLGYEFNGYDKIAYDRIACVQCTAPMTGAEDWHEALTQMELVGADYMVSVSPFTKDLVMDMPTTKGGLLARKVRQEKEPRYYIDGQIWACTTEFLKKGEDQPVSIMYYHTKGFKVDIDEPEDFILGEILEGRGA